VSFPRYPKYKDSGVDWLGEVPEHWQLTRLKNLFGLMKRQPQEDDDIVTAFRDGQVTLRKNRRVEGFTNAIQEHGYQRVHEGDLVIHAMDAFAGAIGVSDSTGKSTPVYSVCTPKHSCVNVYYYGRLMRYMALSGYINSLSKGIRERSTEFRWNEAADVLVAVPPPAEQSNIVAFLKDEAGNIDALVAEQQRLMELLKEKRQAVISHAVTKGLNPRAPMKPSGIEWLSDVPEHWDVRPAKYLASIGNGSTPDRENPEYWRDGTYPWLTSSAVNQSAITAADEFVTTRALNECHLPKVVPPAVLLGITGQGRTRGMASTLLVEATINQHLAYLKPIPATMDVHFLRLVFDMLYTYLRRDSDEGGSTKGAITCEQIGRVKIAVPPPREQKAIVEYVGGQANPLAALAAEAQKAIDLLQERRTALISAAVTGQIDVRKFAAA
jgi:type I restriction enzyme S subunit